MRQGISDPAYPRGLYVPKRTVALAALEACLVNDLALDLKLLHRVYSLAARLALVTSTALKGRVSLV